MRAYEAREISGMSGAVALQRATAECAVHEFEDGARAGSIRVLARAFRDNPLNRAVVRGGAARRERANRHGARAMLEARDDALRLVARSEGTGKEEPPLGVLIGAAPRGYPFAAPPMAAQLRCLLGQGWPTAQRWGRVYRQLDAVHPLAPHWYLDVLGVDPTHQGAGVGKRLLAEWIARVDADRAASYLETDRRENLAFYRRVGFETTRELSVMGVPVWCMWRPAGAAAAPRKED